MKYLAISRWFCLFCLLCLTLGAVSCGKPRVQQPPPQPVVDAHQELAALMNLGDQRMASGLYSQAAEAYAAALGNASDIAEVESARLALGRARLAEGKPEQVIDILLPLTSAEASPDAQVQAALYLAEARKMLGQMTEVSADLMKLINFSPRPLTTAEEGRALDLLVKAQVALGRYDQATKSLLLLETTGTAVSSACNARLLDIAPKASSAGLEEMLSQPRPPKTNAILLYALAASQLREGRLPQAATTLSELRDNPAASELDGVIMNLTRELGQAQLVNHRAIGVVLPLSGPYRKIGDKILAAVELGLGVMSQSGGPSPVLYIADSKAEAKATEEAMKDLVNNKKVMAVIGPISAGSSLAAARQAQALGVSLLNLSTVPGLTKSGEFVFQNSLTPDAQVKALLDEIVTRRGRYRLAILAPENGYGKGFAQLFTQEANKLGAEVVRKVTYKPGQTDFSGDIKKLVKLPPGNYRPGLPDSPKPVIDFEALFIPDIASRAAMLAPQLAYYDVSKVVVMGTNLWHDATLAKEAGKYLSASVIPDVFDPGAPGTMTAGFVRDYEDLTGGDPGALEAQAYDTARLVRWVLGGAGSPRTRMMFKEELAQVQGVDGLCGPMVVGPEGNILKPVKLFTVKNRGFVILKPEDILPRPGDDESTEAAATEAPSG